MPNGAHALMRTLVEAGVTVCFTNPGTSEMHFVAALDSSPEMRAVLTLFEGVATGAADGYARMTGRPAATLLHLGPGLGNGLANLHNARKAHSPIVNIVGDHATYHVRYETQLQSDIETIARNVSPDWTLTSSSSSSIGTDAASAIAAARGLPSQVATLILPADVSWGDNAEPCRPSPPPNKRHDQSRLQAAADALRSGHAALFLGGRALQEPALVVAAQVAATTNARLLAEVFPARIRRGAGLPAIDRLAYFSEMAGPQLAGLEHLILVDAKAPVSFFAYPDKESYLPPPDCTIHQLTDPSDDVGVVLDELAELVGASNAELDLQQEVRPAFPAGELTADKACQVLAALLPENAIISDEAQTSGLTLAHHTAGAPPHDVLTLTGGAIGQGLPVAIGAAIASPDRPVFALEGEGSAMYTIQSLWTMAREGLDVTVLIFNNRSYAILNIELNRVGADGGGPKARSQLDLSNPDLDFVRISQGLGVPAVRAEDCQQLVDALQNAIAEDGPHLIELII